MISSYYTLVIAEKPKAARKIAEALSYGRAVKKTLYNVPYWVLRYNGSYVVVASAVGHLYGLTTSEHGYPVFNYFWAPLYEIDDKASYTRKYLAVLKKLATRAKVFVNACDYDVEGSVIGYMVIKEIGDLRRAKRMKFSSLVDSELRAAFHNLQPLDWPMIEAGLCRHELDWLWGINISRALMDAVKHVTGRKVILSAGRVQTPTLVEVAKREVSRRLHVPLPRFSVKVVARTLSGDTIQLTLNEEPRTITEAREIAKKVRSAGFLVVTNVEKRVQTEPPPPPFNLGDLQAEAYRVYKLSPMTTQKIAEDLYLDALISYPRTNSQKLPPNLNNRAILESLSRQKEYRELVTDLLRETGGILKPRQGTKDDPAHPAIHPTGKPPARNISRKHKAIYDLIVRRYLACFAKPAQIAKFGLTAKLGRYSFSASGSAVLRKGWMKYYPFTSKGETLPKLPRPGEKLLVVSVKVATTYTKPPEAFTKASIVKWMEGVGIGTEATRARIVETLFDRGYLKSVGGKVRVTDLGLAVAELIETYFPDLSSVKLTRTFEEYMEMIRAGRMRRDEVIAEAKKVILMLISEFEKKKRDVGIALARSIGIIPSEPKCAVCTRLAEMEGLCKYHYEALQRAISYYREWKERMGVSFGEYLQKISKLKTTGEWVREVAEAILHGRIAISSLGRVS